jgi:hypothetical protein
MARFIQINDEIINLDRVFRVERAVSQDQKVTVHVHFAGTEPNESPAIYTDDSAAALWAKFSALAERWNVPAPVGYSPAGAGRVNDQQP